MSVFGLDHINIDTCHPDETIAFYTSVLGLVDRPSARPAFATPGAWLWSGGRAVVHLNFHEQLPPAESSGRFNHIAFSAEGFDELCTRLDHHGIEYRVSRRPDIDLRQIFLTDPNGIEIELNVAGPFDE